MYIATQCMYVRKCNRISKLIKLCTYDVCIIVHAIYMYEFIPMHVHSYFIYIIILHTV